MPVAKTSVFHVIRQPGNRDYEGLNYGWDIVWENGQSEWGDSLTRIRSTIAVGGKLHRGLHPEKRGVQALPFGDEPDGWQVYWGESTRQMRDSVTAALETATVRHPELYPTQAHFLFGVFLVGGTGWEWRGGMLVNDDYKLPAETSSDLPDFLLEAAAEVRQLLAQMGETIQVDSERLPRRLLLDSSASIANLPADIRPEWLTAAQDALALALSDRFDRTRQDDEILGQAKARIAALNA